MWRWPVVAKRKEISGMQKAKVYSLYSKLIVVAISKAWGDATSPAVHDMIAKAKKNNVPNDIIDRAIKKWTWEDKNSTAIEEIIYEWYGTWWAWFIVKILTDNKNRTASDIRHIYSKNWWNLWESGSLSSFAFKYIWACYIPLEGKTIEELEETIIESGAEDYFEEDGKIKIICELKDLTSCVNYLKSKWVSVDEYAPEYIANNLVEITDFDKAIKILKLMDDLEDYEDVEDFWTNYTMSDELALKAREAIENARFRS